ncbi:MAG: CRTAC1 family protein, partial [Bryobacteraceae bacterium]|nr:CRTAC1 family protein [Bryobacteraceae bacterium]
VDGGRIRETYRQPLQLFRNRGKGKFIEVSREVQLLSLPPQSARGGSYADFDNDGDLDIVVSVMEGKPQLLENRNGNRAGNWLRLRLEGTRSNRMGVGARVKVTAQGLTQYSSVRAGGSYLSSNDPRLHFGLGRATEADIEVTWPSRKTQKLTAVKANQELLIRETP